MGVALLLAAVCGILLVALPGTGRIVQLRLLNRRRNRSQFVTAPNEPATELEQQVVSDQPGASRRDSSVNVGSAFAPVGPREATCRTTPPFQPDAARRQIRYLTIAGGCSPHVRVRKRTLSNSEGR